MLTYGKADVGYLNPHFIAWGRVSSLRVCLRLRAKISAPQVERSTPPFALSAQLATLW